MSSKKMVVRQENDRCYVQQVRSPKKHYPCGHTGPSKFILWIFGRNVNNYSFGEACPECSLKELLASPNWRCALCGKGIFARERVRLLQVSAVSWVYKMRWVPLYRPFYSDTDLVAVCQHHSSASAYYWVNRYGQIRSTGKT